MAQVGIIMGSDSDMPVMKEAIAILEGFDIQIEVDIVSVNNSADQQIRSLEAALKAAACLAIPTPPCR